MRQGRLPIYFQSLGFASKSPTLAIKPSFVKSITTILLYILIFNITIEEVISQNFNIEANTYNEAISIAKEKYNNGEYVLEPGNLLEKRIAVLNGKNCEWIEF